MTANERIKQIRLYRRLASRELAIKAGISASEVSLIERRMRTPKTDTLQRIAAALDVSTSYLLSELNADLPIKEALAKESLQIFLRDAQLGPEEGKLLREVSEESSAPDDVRGWQHLTGNLSFFRRSLQKRP
jgi:transcriptional regulator with XRE-family HTH domain